MDPVTNILYVSSRKQCSGSMLVPAEERDDGEEGTARGETVADWHRGPANFSNIEGVPILKPPYSRITAIDMNTGEHLWWIPNGDTPQRLVDHPLLEGVDLPNTGQTAYPHPLVTGSLLIYGEGRGGEARLHAVDKFTGEPVGTIDLPAPTSSQPISFMHEGQQYLLLSVAQGGSFPGSHIALRLP